jgi:thioredoxin 1
LLSWYCAKAVRIEATRCALRTLESNRRRFMSKDSGIRKLQEVDFQVEILDKDRLTLVLFEAKWSGLCLAVRSILNGLFAQFGEVLDIVSVDFDSNPRLTEKYGIHVVPTILFFRKGSLVERISGTVSRKTLVETCRSQL